MSLAKATLWTGSSTLIKIGIGLIVIKLLVLKYGPEGIGLAGNYRQLIIVLGVLSGAGIFNGVTKYVAQYQKQPKELQQILGSSSTIILLFSLLLTLVFTLFAKPISGLLFGDVHYYRLFYWLAFIQIAIAYANFALAILKGYRDAKFNASAIMIGNLLGVLSYVICLFLYGYVGALIGLALIPGLIVLPAFIFLIKRNYITLQLLRPTWQPRLIKKLASFTLMSTITCITLPIAYVIMRNLLAKYYGWQEVGLWQGVTSVSDAYLQFITASFTVYLLPTLSQLQDKQAIKRELLQTLRFVFFGVTVVSLLIWLCRDLVIMILFTKDFMPMRSLFSWQLMGDIAKVCSYIFGYLVIAKASLKFYFIAEFSQFVLLVAYSHYFIPLYGALGASIAYMAAYFTYFVFCITCFYFYCRKS